MLGRIGRDRNSSNDDEEPSIHGITSLLGGDGVSLNGESVQLPGDANYQDSDDISSINTSVYGGAAVAPSAIRIVGAGDAPVDPIGTTIGDIKGSQAEQVKAASDESPGGASGCLPTWIADAKPWLKGVIVLSMALFVGAVVLIVVAAGLTKSDVNSSTSSSKGSLDSSPPVTLTDRPSTSPSLSVAAPPSTPFPADNATPPPLPTFAPAFSQPSGMPVTKKTSKPSVIPWVSPTGVPSKSLSFSTVSPSLSSDAPTVALSFRPSRVATAFPSFSSTLTPSNAPVTSVPVARPVVSFLPSVVPSSTPTVVQGVAMPTVFYVTGGRPQSSALTQYSTLLSTLPDEGNSFMVNVGDWNSPFATGCNEQSYQDVDALYSLTSVPVYFVPADNEYNDCPDPSQAFGFWISYLANYEKKYWAPTTYDVAHDLQGYEENFAFALNRALFVGVNVVAGTVHNATEWAERQKADLEWIQVNFYIHRIDIDVMVIFAHSDPSIQSNSPFFSPLQDRIANEYKIPTILLHRNIGTSGWLVQPRYNGVDNYTVVVVEGGMWPPMRAEIDPLNKTFLFDQSSWYNNIGLQ